MFQWKRLENLIVLAKDNVTKMSNAVQTNKSYASINSHCSYLLIIASVVMLNLKLVCRQQQSKLDLTDTIKDGARLFLVDEGIRRQLLLALTEDSKLHIQEVQITLNFYHLSSHMNLFFKLSNISLPASLLLAT